MVGCYRPRIIAQPREFVSEAALQLIGCWKVLCIFPGFLFLYFPWLSTYIGFSTYPCHKAPAVEHGIALLLTSHGLCKIFSSLLHLSSPAFIGPCISNLRESRFSRIFFLFHFSISISRHFHFTFHSRSRSQGICISLFILEMSESDFHFTFHFSNKKWKRIFFTFTSRTFNIHSRRTLATLTNILS